MHSSVLNSEVEVGLSITKPRTRLKPVLCPGGLFPRRRGAQPRSGEAAAPGCRSTLRTGGATAGSAYVSLGGGSEVPGVPRPSQVGAERRRGGAPRCAGSQGAGGPRRDRLPILHGHQSPVHLSPYRTCEKRTRRCTNPPRPSATGTGLRLRPISETFPSRNFPHRNMIPLSDPTSWSCGCPSSPAGCRRVA